jgi:hypothetical protein
MRKLVIALFAVSVLALPAHAQARRGASQGPTPEEIQKQRDNAELDLKYKAAIKQQSSAQTTKKDPWANMRGTPDGK